MHVFDPGHHYALQNNKSTGQVELKFFKDAKINGDGYPGTTNQEVCRALIDRVKFLNDQEPHPVNYEIIRHLREVIVLHEQRHLDRLVDKDYPIEDIPVQPTGHFI